MWLDSGGFSNAFLNACRNGGAFELRQLTWAYKEAVESREAHADPDVIGAAIESQEIFDWFKINKIGGESIILTNQNSDRKKTCEPSNHEYYYPINRFILV
jgi:hypothetical protein